MKKQAKPFKKLGFGLLGAGVLIGVTGFVGMYFWFSSQNEGQVAFYNATSATTKERVYKRHTTPASEFTFQEGSAADDYKAAWRLFNTIDIDHGTLSNVIRWGQGDSGVYGELLHTQVPEACVKAGIPEGVANPIIARTPEILCTKLLESMPALKLMEQGSLKTDNRSPFHIWDAWKEEEKRPLGIHFLNLMKVNLAFAYIDELNNNRAQQLTRLFTSLRIAQDLQQGSNLINTMIGVSVTNQTTKALAKIVKSGDLDEAQLQRVIKELTYIASLKPTIRYAFESEYLWISGITLPQHDALNIPDGIKATEGFETDLYANGSANPLEKLLLESTTNDFHTMWKTILPELNKPSAHRIKVYKETSEVMQKSLNPLSQIAGLAYEKYDAKLHFAHSHIQLIALNAASQLYKSRTGNAPKVMADLGTLGFKLLTTDPATDKPFVLSGTGKVLSQVKEVGPFTEYLEHEDTERLTKE